MKIYYAHIVYISNLLKLRKETLAEVINRCVPEMSIIAIYIDKEVWYTDSRDIPITTHSESIYSVCKIYPCAFVFNKKGE